MRLNSNRRPVRKGLASVSLVALLLLTFTSLPSAHDIPTEVVIQVFVRPEGNRLHFVARLPLIVLLNMNLPKRGPGYLDFEQLDQPLVDSARSLAEGVALLENDSRLQRFEVRETRVSLPSDRSFATYEEAMACLQGPKLPVNTDLFWNQGFFDAHLEYSIQSDRSEFALRMMIAAGLAGRTLTTVQFMPPEGTTRSYQLVNDVGVVRLDPRWNQAAWVFAEAGFFQVFDRIDFLLFLICLVVPLRGLRDLVQVVGSFAAAHSITLIAATYTLAPSSPWSQALLGTLIALSIVYVAIENALAANLRRRWLVALGFGFIHGFGFSFALHPTVQFAGSHFLVSLVSFNAGIELGQIVALAIIVPALTVLFRHTIAERLGTLVLSVLIAHTGWHWMTGQADTLRMLPWPVPDLMLAVTLVRLALIVVIVAGVIWVVATQLWRKPASQEVLAAESDLPWGAWDQTSGVSEQADDARADSASGT